MQNDTGAFILYRTNIGNSGTSGAEIFAEYGFSINKQIYMSVFYFTAFMNARYKDAFIKSGNTNVDIDGNKVESVPVLSAGLA